MSIEERLRSERITAMKAGDRPTVNVIRQVESEVSLAKSAPGFTGAVDDALYLKTIESYTKRMQKAKAEFEAAGDRGREQADKLAFEIDYLSQFVPTKLGEAETLDLVRAAIADLGADDPRMAGRVIGAVMKSGSDVDGAVVARLVQSELGA